MTSLAGRGARLAAVGALIALMACGQGVVTPPMSFAVEDLPGIAHPPTPDPAQDPGIAEPQVWLSPLYLSNIEITAIGEGRLEFAVLGSVPSTCHSVKASVTRSQRVLDVALWSEAPVDQICTQVLTTVAHVVGVDDLGAGTYVVRIDGIEISEVTLAGVLAA